MAFLIDSNLLAVLVANAIEPRIMARHKRLREFVPSDTDRLHALLANRTNFVTPGVISEASNLLRQIGEPDRSTLTAALGELIRASWVEVWYPHARAATHPFFEELGATDTALLDAATERVLHLVTADARLAAIARALRIQATNFHHLRSLDL